MRDYSFSGQDQEDMENGQYYGNDNPYNGSDDEEGGDFYQSYMEGFYGDEPEDDV